VGLFQLKDLSPQPIVWGFKKATGKNIVEGEDPGPEPMAEVIRRCLRYVGPGKNVIFPDTNEFVSEVLMGHKKDEKQCHVKAYRGSKDGNYYSHYWSWLQLTSYQAICFLLLSAYYTASGNHFCSSTWLPFAALSPATSCASPLASSSPQFADNLCPSFWIMKRNPG
jgi:hypothetical protein